MKRILLGIILFAISTPAWAGYTIFTYPQVTPEFVIVHDAYNTVSVKNPGATVTLPVGSVIIYKPATHNIYSATVTDRQLLLDDPAGTATDSAVLSAFPGLRTKVTADIQDIRAQALEKSTKNSGVSAIYDENYQASVAFTAGTGSTTLMRNGMTATAYLTGFGARLGMTAAQFAAYIIAENKRVGPTAYQVEDEYLRLAYGVIPVETSVTKLLGYAAAYRTFCGL